MDGMTVTYYRNISFVVTMTPLLLFAEPSEVVRIIEFWPELVISGVCGGLYLAMTYASYKSLPVGTANTVGKATSIVFLVIAGRYFFGDKISFVHLCVIALLVITSMWFTFQKNPLPHLDNRTERALVFVMTGSLLQSVCFLVLTKISKEIDPLVAGYFWECSIGICTAFLIGAQSSVTGRKKEVISWKNKALIAAAAFPTVIGTACFASAVSIGPVAVASAIGVLALIEVTLLCKWMYGDTIRPMQWVAMLFIIAEIVALRLLG